MLTFEVDDRDSEAVQKAKRAVYEAQVALQDAVREGQRMVRECQEELVRVRRAEGSFFS